MVNKKISKGNKIDYDNIELSSNDSFELNNESNNNNNKLIFDTEEDIRLKMAKGIIKDYENTLKGDSYFIDNNNNLSDKIIEGLQTDILKSKNKVSVNIDNVSKIIENINNKNYKESIFKGHNKPITAVRLFKNYIYSVGKDGSVIRYNIMDNNKDIIYRDNSEFYNKLYTIDITFDGRYLATGGSNGVLIIIDLITNSVYHTFELKSQINDLRFKHNSYILYAILSNRSLRVFDISQKSYIEQFYGHKSRILKMDILNDSSVITIGEDKEIYIWNIDKSTQLVFKERPYWVDGISALNSNQFITVSQDGEICLWNNTKNRPIYSIRNVHEGNWIQYVVILIEVLVQL